MPGGIALVTAARRDAYTLQNFLLLAKKTPLMVFKLLTSPKDLGTDIQLHLRTNEYVT